MQFNKKTAKSVFIAIAVIAVIVLMFKLVSLWDSKRGAVDVDDFQTTSPATEVEVEPPDIPDIQVREPTDEEREELANGSITKDELIQNIVDDAIVTPSDDSPHGKESEQSTDIEQVESSETSQSAETGYGQRIAEIIAEVYVLRDEYVIALEHMYQEAETSLSELVKAENTEGIASLVSSYLSKANELEVQCDEKIDAIVAEMKGLIEDNDGDMTPVDTIIETYINEKATKKAWYIERLKEKGLIS